MPIRCLDINAVPLNLPQWPTSPALPYCSDTSRQTATPYVLLPSELAAPFPRPHPRRRPVHPSRAGPWPPRTHDKRQTTLQPLHCVATRLDSLLSCSPWPTPLYEGFTQHISPEKRETSAPPRAVAKRRSSTSQPPRVTRPPTVAGQYYTVLVRTRCGFPQLA
jgi:hypothetical protein